ncbi:hypothetical protein A6R68_11319, partial [Neotoma lepida]
HNFNYPSSAHHHILAHTSGRSLLPHQRPSQHPENQSHPKTKGEHPGLSIGDVAKTLGEMWNNTAADDKHDDRQPHEKTFSCQAEGKHKKDIVAYRAKGKSNAMKRGVVKAEKSKKKKEEEDEKDEEEEEEEDR